jgi:AraC-like DNA-binding protein
MHIASLHHNIPKQAYIQEKLIPAWLQAVVAMDLLDARNIEYETALRGTTLFIQDLPFANKWISPWHFEQLLINCDRLWQDRDFSFLFGHKIAESGLGPVGDLLREDASFNLWVQYVNQYFRLLCPSQCSRLHENKCNFQKLSDLIRAEKAVLGLLTKNETAEVLSSKLRFHDTSNFRRAFKRWTGMTPKNLKLAYQEFF